MTRQSLLISLVVLSIIVYSEQCAQCGICGPACGPPPTPRNRLFCPIKIKSKKFQPQPAPVRNRTDADNMVRFSALSDSKKRFRLLPNARLKDVFAL